MFGRTNGSVNLKPEIWPLKPRLDYWFPANSPRGIKHPPMSNWFSNLSKNLRLQYVFHMFPSSSFSITPFYWVVFQQFSTYPSIVFRCFWCFFIYISAGNQTWLYFDDFIWFRDLSACHVSWPMFHEYPNASHELLQLFCHHLSSWNLNWGSLMEIHDFRWCSHHFPMDLPIFPPFFLEIPHDVPISKTAPAKPWKRFPPTVDEGRSSPGARPMAIGEVMEISPDLTRKWWCDNFCTVKKNVKMEV